MSDIRSGLANNDDQRTSSPTTLAAFLQGLYSITCTFKTGAFDQAFGSNWQDGIKRFLVNPVRSSNRRLFAGSHTKIERAYDERQTGTLSFNERSTQDFVFQDKISF